MSWLGCCQGLYLDTWFYSSQIFVDVHGSFAVKCHDDSSGLGHPLGPCVGPQATLTLGTC